MSQQKKIDNNKKDNNKKEYADITTFYSIPMKDRPNEIYHSIKIIPISEKCLIEKKINEEDL